MRIRQARVTCAAGSRRTLAVIALCTTIAACEASGRVPDSLWPAAVRFAADRPLLEQLTAAVEGNPGWFEPLAKRRHETESRYDSEHARISPYLEGDVYLYADATLSGYLEEVLDGLLDGFDGRPPEIDVLVETNTRFSAYVDEMGLIHLSTGLLRSLTTEDQLAGVLAHELAHFLLRHNLDRHATVDIARVAGLVSSVGQQLVAARQGDRSNARQQRLETRLSLGADSFGLLWADLMAPLWSRDSEREADRLAMDLMKAAGYNPEELLSAVALIHDAAAERSARVERVRTLASGFIEANRTEARGWRDDELGEYVGDLGASLMTRLADKGVDSLDEAGATHDARNERIDALKRYLNAAYDAFELPPEPRSERFTRIVTEGARGDALNRDLAAVETLIAVAKKDLNEANRHLADMNAEEGEGEQVSIALARMSVQLASRNHATALAQLERLVANERAPAEAFIKLAKLQADEGLHANAERTLVLGADRIGRSYRFLPTLIDLHHVAGDIEAAERAALECAAFDDTGWVENLEFATGISLPVAGSYYEECQARLGYDIRARQIQDRRRDWMDMFDQGKDLIEQLGER